MVLTIIAITLNFFYTKDLVSLPAPLYGGDGYYQLGAVNHVKYGGNPLSSTTTTGEIPVYLPLYSFLVGNLAKILNIDAITAIFIFSYITSILAVIIIFLFIHKLFNDILLSFLSAFYFITFIPLPSFKYTFFGAVLIIPLFIYSLYNFIRDNSIKNSILLGIIYGLCGLSHPIIFIYSSLILAIFFIYYVLWNNIGIHIKLRTTKKINLKIIIDIVSRYAIVFFIGVPIAMLWWFTPIFIFHAKSSFSYQLMISNFSFSSQIYTLTYFVKTLFFNFDSIKGVLGSILALFALFGLTFWKNQKEEIKFLKVLFISSLIIIFHYFITENIFVFNLVPDYIIWIATPIIFTLLFAFGAITLIELLKKIKIPKLIFYSITILLILLSLFFSYSSAQTDKWTNAGKNSLPQQLIGLSDYLVKNSEVNDVILTTKEIGFAVNGLTGRKLMVFRRGHSGPYQFTDLDQREIDAAIILYGNNMEYKQELLKKYDIKYLYWDYYWVQSEYYFDNQGKLVNWFDPLLIAYSNERETILNQNGVKYFIQKSWVDPSIKGDNVPQIDLLFISPANYVSLEHPWNKNLDDISTEVWSYEYQGKIIARLYKIN